MQIEQIQALLEAFDNSKAVSLVWKQGDESIRLKKAEAYPHPIAHGAPVLPPPAPAVVDLPLAMTESPAKPDQQPAPAGETINAPLVGTFYAAPAPGKTAFAAVGDTVKQGQTVCLLEAMKMMSEVPAPFDCKIEEILIEDGELAAFGAPLFRVSRL